MSKRLLGSENQLLANKPYKVETKQISVENEPKSAFSSIDGFIN